MLPEKSSREKAEEKMTPERRGTFLVLVVLVAVALRCGVAQGAAVVCSVGSSAQCRAPTGPCDKGGFCKGLSATCPAHSSLQKTVYLFLEDEKLGTIFRVGHLCLLVLVILLV